MPKRMPLCFFLLLILTAPAGARAAVPSKDPAGAPPAGALPKNGGEAGQTLPEVKTYEELRHAISEARARSRMRVEKAAEREKVREAWEIGRLIDAHVLRHKERADYGAKVLERLSTDLGMSRTELSYMVQFARTYPIYRTSGELTWGHYESLLAINDDREREEVEALASKEKWPIKKLREEVKKRKAAVKRADSPAESAASAPVEKIDPVPHSGNPGTYRVLRATTGPDAGELVLDLGFSTYIRFSGVLTDTAPFAEGDVIVFREKESEVVKSREEELYTYRAWIRRVLDGDTVEAVIELGFGITVRQTLRLRAIDAPEILTREGKEAKAYVEKMLPPETPVYIRTSRSDKYDRYLADIFITVPNGEEQYLNNLLLEESLAVKVHD